MIRQNEVKISRRNSLIDQGKCDRCGMLRTITATVLSPDWLVYQCLDPIASCPQEEDKGRRDDRWGISIARGCTRGSDRGADRGGVVVRYRRALAATFPRTGDWMKRSRSDTAHNRPARPLTVIDIVAARCRSGLTGWAAHPRLCTRTNADCLIASLGSTPPPMARNTSRGRILCERMRKSSRKIVDAANRW